jgi:hypothetical protein
MTIINGIEIDIVYKPMDDIRQAIMNNDPIDDTLHVIAVTSNPCQFARRYILAREFLSRMEQEANVKVYVVELAYRDQQFYVTDKKNPRHLQIHGTIPLWHKENMINIGVKLLPSNWKAMAWIDADVEFENVNWAMDTLKVLNGCRDVVQLFSHAVDMNKHMEAMSIFPSFGFQYSKKSRYGGTGINMWHPGYAWACTKKAYDRMGGLYEYSILGSGDHNMSFSFIGQPDKSLNVDTTNAYKESLRLFQKRAAQLRLGYVPGVIRHHFHGAKKNRKYHERWQILVDNAYNPFIHITKNRDGLLVPTELCPQKMLDEILAYFAERNEDEGYADA